MTRRLVVKMGLLSLFFGACSKKITPPQSQFRAGQLWAFTPPNKQPNARLTILHVEDGGQYGTIVHIAISGLSYGDGQSQIQHLPFTESAIERSVTTLERETGSVPDYTEGYQLWRQAFDAGKAGIFTGTVAEAVDAVTGTDHDHSAR
ncbi:hypothetical protein GC163_02100 [bacterium]|nr:hypothetical protein [bacterium]